MNIKLRVKYLQVTSISEANELIIFNFLQFKPGHFICKGCFAESAKTRMHTCSIFQLPCWLIKDLL